MKKNIIIGCLSLYAIANALYMHDYNTSNLQEKNKQLEQKNICYKTLYNEDYIKKGCDKYFRNDSWYKEYIKDVNKQNNLLSV